MRKTILIVEDVELNIELLVQLLEDDYDLITAGDGLTALALAASHHPDIVLMDISLPVLDGLETTRRLKATPELGHIPVIALTAHAMQGDADIAAAAGVDAYLTKPVDETLLWQTISRLLET